MAFTSIVITHQCRNLDGTFASGAIRFRLTTRMTNTGVTYDPGVPLVATLNGTGQLSVTVPANNDPTTISQVPAAYVVAFELNGATNQAISGDEYTDRKSVV